MGQFTYRCVRHRVTTVEKIITKSPVGFCNPLWWHVIISVFGPPIVLSLTIRVASDRAGEHSLRMQVVI